MIRFERASKAFQTRLALDAVTLDVHRGEVLAVLGHNGAGKSTLLASALGLLHLSGGDIVIGGTSVRRDPRRARRGVGSVLAPAFYEYLSGWDNLRVLTSYSAPVSPADMRATVRFVGLDNRIHEKVRVYSYGMRRRLALAQALLPRPSVLLIDEWEAGLDPEGVRQMRDLILRLNRDQRMTVVVSSHQPAGVEAMCDRVAILRHGRLIFAGRWGELEDDVRLVRLDLDDWDRARAVLHEHGARLGAERDVTLAPDCDVADVVAALVRAGVRVRAVEPVRGNADDLYLRLLSTSDG